ncbi:class I adenylate-forming enzyme family protein [Brevibacterium yomogidense]|uniref:class I adenylate-forming enzyme family protein n=1 Tax=Brevibacterium yomogidense TaxID=946573 RepID=UPI0018DFE237|nr:AMP-binding protein [Brevibacterium yomogidense]
MRAPTDDVDALELNLATRNTLGDALHRVARLHPARAAVIDGEHRVDYATLDAHSEAFAQALLDQGHRRGAPITILMGNSADFLVAYFGIVKAGLVAMPVNLAVTPEDLAWLLEDSGSDAVVADAAFLPLLRRTTTIQGVRLETVIVRDGYTPGPAGSGGESAVGPEGASATDFAATEVVDFAGLAATPVRVPGGRVQVLIDDADTAQCLYTSGTTSKPKGVLTRHSAVVIACLSNALLSPHRWGEDHAVLLNVLPMFHVTALNALCLTTLFAGGTIVLVTPFDPVRVLEQIERHRATTMVGLPMMWRALQQAQKAHERDLTSITTASYAMAPMPQDLLDDLSAMMPRAAILMGSGQTEVVPATVRQWRVHQHTKPESWGPPLPTVETAIMGADGNLLPHGEVGEIVYRGPHVMSGYWNRPDANVDAFSGGWFHSGDLGHQDEEGVVWFVDRLKDIIKSGGENVSSVKVERVVASAPGVLECTVIGVPDDRWGEAVTAVVVTDRLPGEGDEGAAGEGAAGEGAPEDGASGAGSDSAKAQLEADILAHARAHLAGFETPKRVLFVDAMPKTTTGKIRKAQLRGQL